MQACESSWMSYSGSPHKARRPAVARGRPRRRAAEQRDERAPPHSITSSARARRILREKRSGLDNFYGVINYPSWKVH
jgi:hypothetical protein